jgi:ribokinase
MLRAAADEASVDTNHVMTLDAPTGSATVIVADSGENMIVVLPGANGQVQLDEEQLPAAVRHTDVLLLQLETPLATQLAAAQATDGIVILNPAPMPEAGRLPTELLEHVDVLVPNRTELAQLTGSDDTSNVGRLLDRAQQLTNAHRQVVVTLGSEGAAIVTPETITRVPAHVVNAVDSTGAGDTFCGTLAARLADGSDMDAAVETAVRAAALTVTRRGAQASFPTAEELAASFDAPG